MEHEYPPAAQLNSVMEEDDWGKTQVFDELREEHCNLGHIPDETSVIVFTRVINRRVVEVSMSRDLFRHILWFIIYINNQITLNYEIEVK